MADIATRFIDFTQGADLVIDGIFLAEDDGLLTAVVMSLFTDRQANPDDKLPNADLGDDDRRGWWGDEFNEDPRDRIGSRLWLNEAAKQLPAVLERDRKYAQEALQWMVDDGIASRVVVSALSPRQGIRALNVAIYRPDGTASRYQFESFWKGHNGL
ncbi:phage gp46-like protein [Paucimonas lemoignei]|uniref:Phage gp46-like protein n=1 Tax=Paucimonas lemoignei TaxID=29443 RepID=A0A4R3HSZ6_PAULE|nr:phage GP46 family protein [Paucimonas lemoignei]TCS35804.1 phage gp46-like protein [Paucimonas lemoignei]